MLQSTKAMSFIADENLSLYANSTNTQIQSDFSIQAGNTLSFSIGETTITAKEIINNDNNTSILVVESKTNLLEYKGNTSDTLMVGLSAIFASMATLAEKYGVDKTLKKQLKGH